jgi:hypothetical protein
MSLESFCQTFTIRLGKPATPSQLEAAERKLGRSLPGSVRKLYAVGNGGTARGDCSALEIYPIRTALQYADVPRFFDAPWVLWPLIENNDSNPICVCCQAPLTGYVVLVRHGDSPLILSRTLDRFFRSARDFVAEGEFLETSELTTDFAGADRTQGDLAAAGRLIKMAKSLEGDDRTDALCFAADLLGDAEVEQIRALLDFDDAGAADHLAERLKRIPKARGSKVVRSRGNPAKPQRESFDEFVVRCGELLKTAGLKATVVEMYGKKTIRLDPGSVWMNMAMFYEQRRREDFVEFLVDLARKAVRRK